ncbi:MAG: N-acetylmuramic acid 6-phosphate etherase [Rhodobacteraceae bacterium]|nr:N-acetylmuramic acid 6-phosphate etherase [Paracoccaceae bacterium]
MPFPSTEEFHPAAPGIDARPAEEVLSLLLSAQIEAVRAVTPALPQIAEGARLMAETVRAGGRLVYAGAGSSALMANSDGLELPGTYGVDPARILLRMAGGLPRDASMPGATEDDAEDGRAAGALLGAQDLVIAVTASGATPYPLALAAAAGARGARVVAIANVAGAAIFEGADVAICLPTPPEVIAGSTRMGAGTAQKVALNLMSTLAGILLGEVHDGMMVGLVADNAKLRSRARRMVEAIAGVGSAEAEAALARAGGAVKPAVLIADGLSQSDASALLAECGGNLRAARARHDKARDTGRHDTTNQGRLS